MALPLYVLGPNFSREEAKEIRRLLAAREDRAVLLCNAEGHTAGQELPGDVVVVGNRAPTAEQDARGSFKRYASMDEYHAAISGEAQPKQGKLRAESAPAQPEAAEEQPGPDKFEGMDRVHLIRYGAENFPRKRQWATLDTDKLKAELRRLEAGD